MGFFGRTSGDEARTKVKTALVVGCVKTSFSEFVTHHWSAYSLRHAISVVLQQMVGRRKRHKWRQGLLLDPSYGVAPREGGVADPLRSEGSDFVDSA